ncbi:DUF3131 domain-containing protein [Infirmifilum sp.]|uniref:DUF3131 domain-containing protein n=1 Tax=Infirmifilum sp. TaxID=2856575 RepID=UPI003D0FBE9F
MVFTAVLTAILLTTLLPPPELPLTQTVAQPPIDWLDLARTAWNYFKPGFGVSQLGINYAHNTWHYITDWDLGCYLSAIIDAEELGILPRDGPWGADDRIEKLLNFLANRPLHPSGVPYDIYNADTMEPYGNAPSNPSDAGRLLIALYRLKQSRPRLAPRIDYVVQRNGFSKFAGGVQTNGFYGYYIAHGFYLWGFTTPRVIEAVQLPDRLWGVSMVYVYGVNLPIVEITMEPILLAIFEISPQPSFWEWANRAYEAQENRFRTTGKFTAFTEGSLPNPPYYIYEWIVDIYTGGTFDIMAGSGKQSMTPIVFTKAAIGMHAVWGTNYTYRLLQYVLKTKTSNGFLEGVDEVGNINYILTDKTNSMIISAARYAIKKAKKISIAVPQTLQAYQGDTIQVQVQILHEIPLPVQLSLDTPPGIVGIITPSQGTTNFTAKLQLRIYDQTTPKDYNVTLTATTLSGSYSSTLTITVKPKGYTLTVIALDSRGRPVPGAQVTASGITMTTNSSGTLTFKHLNSTVKLEVKYAGITVWGPKTLSLDNDTTITTNLSLHELQVLAITPEKKPLPGALITVEVNHTEISSAMTNTTGYATIPRVPRGNVTIRAYTLDKQVLLGEWHVQVTGDGEIVDPYLTPPSRLDPLYFLPLLATALILSKPKKRELK